YLDALSMVGSLILPYSFILSVPSPTNLCTLSLHDALPIYALVFRRVVLFSEQDGIRREQSGYAIGYAGHRDWRCATGQHDKQQGDRKSTRRTPVTVKSRMPSSA